MAGLLAGAPAPGAPPADPDWHIPPPDTAPSLQPDAQRLAAALEAHEQIAATGGWPVLPVDLDLAPGGRDARVVTLRDRLRRSGDLEGASGTADAWFFDAGLMEGLKRFQTRHGLPPSGRLDARTLAALNVPVEERMAQLRATLLRWSWLPTDFGVRYLLANVPGGTLTLVEAGEPTLTMRIIAGHPDRPTPSFRDTITAVVVDPPWSVPHRIAVEDLLPYQREDPGYLGRLHMRVLDRTGRELDARTIDWNRHAGENFPYFLRQDPGPHNGLGRFKFASDNPWYIYLHDSPSRRLFDLNSRTLSSGCLRVEKAQELAERLTGTPIGGPQAPPVTRRIPLPEPIPLWVVYLTSWVTPDGVVHFRPDVYGRDARLR